MVLEVRDNREAPAIATRTVVLLGLGFVAFAGLAMAGLQVVYRFKVEPRSIDQPLGTFPVPQIQPAPTADYAAFRARQNRELSGYAWVDRGRNMIHVPIDRAMRLIAGKGASAYDPPDPALPANADAPTPPDGAPRATPSLQAGPYGARP